tara:strand:+ start:15428 stop:15754 length:327 start_codon:yes stop_codon:yes gene_type:complete
MKNKKPMNEPFIWGLCGKVRNYSHQGATHPTPSSLSRDTSRTSPQQILHSDNYDFVIANEWMSLLDRPSLSKEDLVQWCDLFNKQFDYIPPLEDFLYADNFTEKHYEL